MYSSSAHVLFLCVLFIVADSENIDLVEARGGLICVIEIVFFIVATLITEVLFEQFLISIAGFNILS